MLAETRRSRTRASSSTHSYQAAAPTCRNEMVRQAGQSLSRPSGGLTREIVMKLPNRVRVSPAALLAIAARHGLGKRAITPINEMGIVNTVYLLGDDMLLRVPRDHPAHIAQAEVEAVAIPAARAAGVRTPGLVAYDDSGDFLPVPYLIVERVHGEALGRFDLEPGATPDVWRELGRDLALLHIGVDEEGPAGKVARPQAPPDPRELVEKRAADGWFTGLEARWLGAWLERLAPAASSATADRFLHLD